MKTLTNLQKFDLDSLKCVDFIDDQQAETLSAGQFHLISLVNDGRITVGKSPYNTYGAVRMFKLELLGPFRVENTNNPGAGGDLFRVTFFDESNREIDAL